MLHKKTLLVVEDNELNRAILSEILSVDYAVMEAENGQVALELLAEHKDKVALVLLDLMMPVMDGHAFLDEMKKSPELSLIPVIVMTQNNSVQDEVAALKHGASDFVPKPYHPEVVLHRVASLIKLRETAALVNQFRYDRLTGLYTKEYFYKKVQQILQENPDGEYSIVCSNIEGFKLINDMLGVKEGDRLLKEAADITAAMVGETGICCRLNADRFLCLQKREIEEADRNRYGDLNGHVVSPLLKSVVMRFGIYEISDRSVSVETMCERALLAADSIKGQYNRYYAVYDNSLRDKLVRERDITAAMETALREHQFSIYLQPKYSLNGDCMAGAEALARWTHPKLGFISPGEFIPLFEKNGFISRMDQYIWEQTCVLLRKWQDAGYQIVPVSVNVSRADIFLPDLVGTLLALTQKYGVDPGYLHLEITESAYVGTAGKIISTVQELRKHGFIVEMDDFGSGYSSLNMLSQIHLDILKLDMTFIQNEIAKTPNKSILNDVIAMAHRLHLGVVAEGIETQEQVNRLRDVNCDYVQGFFFAKPMPSSEFEDLLRKNAANHVESMLVEQSVDSELQNLLVVDENPGYRETVRRALEGYYHILEADSGESAIACINHYDGHSVSAVILSMTLPNNGASMLMRTLRQECRFWNIPVLATIPNGEEAGKWPHAAETDDFLCKCHPIFDLKRRIDRVIDVASLHRRESILRDEVRRDPMTGLFNRRGLFDAIATLRSEDMPLAVCLFDLDGLKKANDTLGHNVGDRMLRAFSELLIVQTRSGDIRCRYGGDEFVVIFRHVASPDTALSKCEDICQAFQNMAGEETFPSSCSCGIALCTGDEMLNFEDVIERADRAMYRAKESHRGHCCLWEPEMGGS